MHPVGFEPTISAGERPKTYALDRGATGTDIYKYSTGQKYKLTEVLRVATTNTTYKKVTLEQKYILPSDLLSVNNAVLHCKLKNTMRNLTPNYFTLIE